MKRILFICGALESPNGICAKAVIDEIARSGIQVDCVCSGDDPICSQAGVEYHLVKRKFFEGLLNYKGRVSPIVYYIGLNMSRALSVLLSMVWPFNGPLYYRNLKKMVEQLLDGRTYDAVIGVYNHYECLLVANYVKKRSPGTKYTAYFLDCLSGGRRPRFFSEETMQKKGIAAEGRVLEQADSVVIMRSHEGYYKKVWKNAAWEGKVSVLDIPLYRPVDRKCRDSASHSKIEMLYMGALQQDLKNPQSFLNIISKGDFKNLRVSFVGPSDCKEMISACVKTCPSEIAQLNSVPHATALKMELDADVLLNIGSMNTRQIPCKIFEYMSTGNPIVSIAPNIEEPSNYYLSVYPKSLILFENESVEDNIKQLKIFLSNMENKDTNEPMEFLERLYICEPKAFVKLIEKLIN